jgi:hypothetical protein
MMKKIFFSVVLGALLFSFTVFAENNQSSLVQKRTAEKKQIIKAAQKATTTPALNQICMQKAVEKRENALIAAVTQYSSSTQSALTARRDALKAAWGENDKTKRKNAINKAWNDYKRALKDARYKLTKSKNEAWKGFNTDRKGCKVPSGEALIDSGVNDQNL